MKKKSGLTQTGWFPLYVIPVGKHSRKDILDILRQHPEVKFVSFVGVDFAGNDTDEKIPVSLFIEGIDNMLSGMAAAQTDGSAVVLPGIASLNDGRVDMKLDINVNWFVDYNYENFDQEIGFYVGTLRIPAFLIHNGRMVDSRSILTNALQYVEQELLRLFKEYPIIAGLAIDGNDVEKISFTCATELEFWVKTPAQEAIVEELTASQVMHEQYWQRVRGNVRTALEEAISSLELYGLGPEMGHKEVGGVKARIDDSGHLSHVMEQLEIDWRYAEGIQTADNEMQARIEIKEIFRMHGLEVTFQAKPILGVAGNGEHTHVGLAARLKSGKTVNLFSPADMEKDFLSAVGYGAVMGILKNYEAVNPIISATNDSLNRLQPGFEAPVCIVTSLGHTPRNPSRNRTVLVGLVRDINNPRATRFEVRSPNPFTNTYLALAAFYLTMLDGVKAAVQSGHSLKELEKELSKKSGEEGFYLEKEREYRSEEDVFEHFSQEERDRLFGRHPATVWENLQNFRLYPEKTAPLTAGGFAREFIDGFAQGSLIRWKTELLNKILPEYIDTVTAMKCLHQDAAAMATDVDRELWDKIKEARISFCKDSRQQPSLLSRLRGALETGDYERASALQVIAQKRLEDLKIMYMEYKRNIID